MIVFTACLISLESVKFDDDPLLPSVKYRQSLIKSLFYKVVTYSLCDIFVEVVPSFIAPSEC